MISKMVQMMSSIKMDIPICQLFSHKSNCGPWRKRGRAWGASMAGLIGGPDAGKRSLKGSAIIFTRWEIKRGTMGGRLESVRLTSLRLPRLGTQHMLFIGKPIILNRGTGENLNDICKPWFISLLNSGTCLRLSPVSFHGLGLNVKYFQWHIQVFPVPIS